jgi:hypothetical protein
VHHDCWKTTRNHANAGETFGILDEEQTAPANQVPPTNLDAKVLNLVGCLTDGTLEAGEDLPCNVAISNQVLVESAAWAGKMPRQSRGTGPVTNDSEMRFFANNHIHHLRTASDTEADNCSLFAWD